MKKFFIGLLLAVAFFVVPCFCVKAPSAVNAAAELQLDSSEIIEETEDSKFFRKEIIPPAIEIIINACVTFGAIASFLKSFKKDKKDLVETTASNVAATKETIALKKELKETTHALKEALTTIKELREIIKLGLLNTPSLIANGTAKKIKEVFGDEEREETTQANEQKDKT